MTRVMHIITRMILGGAQENTLYTCTGLAGMSSPRGTHPWEVRLVTGPAEGPEGELLEEARSQGLQVTVVPELRREIGLLADWRAYRALCSLIRAERPAIVHTHSSKAGFLGRMAASAERTPVIIHTIHGLPFHPYERWWLNRLYVAAERMAARRTDRLICVAEAMRRTSLAAGVGRPEQYRVVYSGMAVEAFGSDDLDGAAVRRAFGFGADDVVVGKIARLFEFKGHEDVLRAFARAAEDIPSLRLLLVGDGILRAQLERLAEELGISGRVAFAGLVPASRIPEMLAAMDLVVHASYREGLARVLPQALISRLPVVSYDVDGAPEVVIPGRTGVLVRPGDIEGLAEGMSVLAQDPELRSRMGEEGRRLFCKRFSREVMVNEICAIYESCLAEKNVPAP